MSVHQAEVDRGERFAFGENWRRLLSGLDEGRIDAAARSLREGLRADALTGRRFLDAGCGSGLFSLAARRLGADVVSFDFDPASVACARALRDRFRPGDDGWTITEGSVLDEAFLAGLGTFDVVYSWGVLHHTGAMWDAIARTAERVAPGGAYWIALYNDQGFASRAWLAVKRTYNALPRFARPLLLGLAFVRLWGPTFVRDTLSGRPGRTWRAYASTSRGMSAWRDVVDWVGGLPFEVARPDDVVRRVGALGFDLAGSARLERGHGCNEFVFVRRGPAGAAPGGIVGDADRPR